MNRIVAVQKNDEENPVPTIWRNTFHNVVEALKDEDYIKLRDMQEVRDISQEDMERIIYNVKDYGCHLINLPIDTWNTSICRWQGGGVWDVLIDLYTSEEGRSDLVLTARAFEENGTFLFEIFDIYVP